MIVSMQLQYVFTPNVIPIVVVQKPFARLYWLAYLHFMNGISCRKDAMYEVTFHMHTYLELYVNLCYA